jgi:hypothetical protein
MKYLIVFRGECDRVSHNNLELFFNNIKLKILNPLISSNKSYDIILSTYSNSKNISQLSALFKPIKIITMDYINSNQEKQFIYTLKNILEYEQSYDMVLILRFDIIYKLGIQHWSTFNNMGFYVAFKENDSMLYESTRYNNDTIIVFNSNLLKDIYNTLFKCLNDDPTKYFPGHTLHNLESIFKEKNPIINFYHFTDEYYNSMTANRPPGSRVNPYYIMFERPYFQNDISMVFSE